MKNTLAQSLLEQHRRRTASASPWPSTKYFADAVGFVREVLGFEPWEAQTKILKALETRDFVTIRSGHRIGKSFTAASAALWFYATRKNARVILTAPSAKQIGEVVWRDVRQLWAQAKMRATKGTLGASALDGSLAVRYDTGLRSDDNRQIIGYAPEDEGRFQGLAGELFFIVDEASLINDRIYNVILSNLAGGGKLLMIGNPNVAKGYFFESFTNERFERMHVPSTSTPNVVQGRTVIRYLATKEWCEDRAREWGPESPEYRIRVLGEFVENAEGRLFPPEMISRAETRWHDMASEGPLTIGIDPAGVSGAGDESSFACRRGKKITRLHTRRGLSPDGHVVETVGLIKDEGAKGEAVVIVDIDGDVGAKVWRAFRDHREQHEDAFRLVGLKGMRDERRQRMPKTYDTMRDELWHNLRDSFREGLAIPEDLKLVKELAEMRTYESLKGRERVTPKDDLRRALGRSPDRADSITLACYEIGSSVEHMATAQLQAIAAAASAPPRRAPQMDPYASGNGGGMDPYGGHGAGR